MKKYVYFIVLIVIINNIFIINKNSNLKKDISKLNKNSNIQETINEQKYINYLYKISNSKYLENIDNIKIESNNLQIKLKLDSNKDLSKITKDIEKSIEKSSIKINVHNDEYIIIEFGE